jgi:uncharacterized surface protein with fasciclin (FAS1) repeats
MTTYHKRIKFRGAQIVWHNTGELRIGQPINQGVPMRKVIAGFAAVLALLGSASNAFAANIVDTATEAGSFKTFVAALKAAGFTEALKSSGPYTVFAPSDEAFAKLPKGTWNALVKDKAKLAQVLAYHVVPGKILVAEVKPGNIKTLQGGTLHLTSDNGKVTVNGAQITQSDVQADNGIIHAIDTVVLPNKDE